MDTDTHTEGKGPRGGQGRQRLPQGTAPRNAGTRQELGEARKEPPWSLPREHGSAHTLISDFGLQQCEGICLFLLFEAIQVGGITGN